MKKKLIIIIICLVVTGLIAARLYINKKQIDEKKQPAKLEDAKIPVNVTLVTAAVQHIGIVKTGILTPFKEAKVVSAANGSIQRLQFNLGDNVAEGQVIAMIDTRLLQYDLQKAAFNVNKLHRDLQTYTDLQVGNAATQQQVNDIRQNLNDAVTLQEQLQRQIADAGIKAPIGGIIAAKNVEEGMFVNAGTELATIVNLSRVKVRVNLTEGEVYQVRKDQKVKLTTDVYTGTVFWGAITFISSQGDMAHNYTVEITAANNNSTPLRSGTFVYADFSKTTPQKIVLIPREALIESIQNASVYVVQNGQAILRSIQAGKIYGGNIEVLRGLAPGEQVVTSGQINLKDGAFINISK